MLNNNNFQLKINNFWDMVSEMNDIHMELWENRNDSQLKPEPDAGTLEILANCDAIEEAIENQNQIEVESQSQVKSDSRKDFENYMAELEAYMAELDRQEAEYEEQCIQEELEEAIANEIEYQHQCLIDELIEAEQNIIDRIVAVDSSIQGAELDRLVQAEMLDPGYLDTCIQAARPEWYEPGINNIQEYLATDNTSQIEYDDDMDEIDRRNIERFLEARREVA